MRTAVLMLKLRGPPFFSANASTNLCVVRRLFPRLAVPCSPGLRRFHALFCPFVVFRVFRRMAEKTTDNAAAAVGGAGAPPTPAPAAPAAAAADGGLAAPMGGLTAPAAAFAARLESRRKGSDREAPMEPCFFGF